MRAFKDAVLGIKCVLTRGFKTFRKAILRSCRGNLNDVGQGHRLDRMLQDAGLPLDIDLIQTDDEPNFPHVPHVDDAAWQSMYNSNLSFTDLLRGGGTHESPHQPFAGPSSYESPHQPFAGPSQMTQEMSPIGQSIPPVPDWSSQLDFDFFSYPSQVTQDVQAESEREGAMEADQEGRTEAEQEGRIEAEQEGTTEAEQGMVETQVYTRRRRGGLRSILKAPSKFTPSNY